MSTQSHIDKVNLQPMVIPYPTHVGAPKIEPQDLTAFKTHGLNKVDRVVKRRFDELIKEAETLQNSILLQQEVYESNYKFEPKIGKYITYTTMEMEPRHCLSLDPRNGIRNTSIRWN